MLRGLYTATAGMITQQRRHDTITNNIANMNTPGFKQGQAVARSFPEVLIALVGGDSRDDVRQIGSLSMGVFAEENIPLFAQGDLMETGNPADFALLSAIRVPDPDNPGGFIAFDLNGKAIRADGEVLFQPQAFFTVQDRDGAERYTRNGTFTLDETGQIVTGNGDRVLDAIGEPIRVAPDVTEVRVDALGQLYDGETGARLIDAAGAGLSLRLSRIDNPHQLIREGDGNFRLDGNADAPIVLEVAEMNELGVEVRQGFIERSNVDAAQAMVDLMIASRAYEANQKVVQYYDRSLEKAVNEVGRV